MKQQFMFLCSLLLASFAQAAAVLYTATDGAAVKLQWHPTAWAETQVGYTLKRRVVAADGSVKAAWKSMGPAVLTPSVDYNRDYTQSGLNAAQVSEINQSVQAKNLNSRPIITVDAMREKLRKTKQILAGDAIAMMRDATHAFAWGLAYVDNKVPPGVVYEYGLFEVFDGGVFSAAPVVVNRPMSVAARKDWVVATNAEFCANRHSSSITLNWRMELTRAQSMAVAYFMVERRGDAETEWKLIQKEIPYYVVKAVGARWSAMDAVPGELADKPVHYRIIPVDMFQQKMGAYEYTIQSVRPDPRDSSQFGPVKLASSQQDKKISLTWVQEGKQWNGSELAGFRLRKDFDFKTSYPLWTADARVAELEVGKVEVGEKYRLDAIYKDWDGHESEIQSAEAITLDPVK